MPSSARKSDTLDDWAVCQILIDAAIDEIYGPEQEKDPMYAPWGNYFPRKFERSN
jgi:hypothetical protein